MHFTPSPTAENSSVLRKPPCTILDSQLLAGKVGTKARDSSLLSFLVKHLKVPCKTEILRILRNF